ncbi:2Fe-2S iron-sulfur cluster-binding protein [Defluviimonas sp. D31]|uniref:2Fe-2S iron-sulfur cluster-binding protein n=1 Tax=Defluviimonas sp. D31 TaxID=3083253 RepID=UPI00296F572D|nr:2Fe-2S iron-sulfur cluster-binding protein [Defluviimonas sp. D31]MDW4551232.1 2Fe-2S iron-sulfur cluster-binding protein [Defluviimonas sp. D31]
MSRLPRGGLIDRDRTLPFTFDGVPLNGHPGDTLASALLANGRHLVARSLKYHRPRGILSAGLEEPCALVTVTDASGSTSNLKATEVVLSDGLSVTSQNAWPRVDRDFGALLQLCGKALSAGFYYKTFMWPKGAWAGTYSRVLRRAAGHGRADPSPDPAIYDKRRKSCDILVIGGGAAGLSAALTSAHSGSTVVLVEQDRLIGGALLSSRETVEGLSARDWAEDAAVALGQLSNVTVLSRTLAFGHYDHGLVQAVETPPAGGSTRAILWKIRAHRIILAAGAIERPVVFPGNDRPGVMLAGAVRSYVRRFAIAPGRRAAVAVTDADERADTTAALAEAGIEVVAELEPGAEILGTSGRLHLRGLRWRDGGGKRRNVACDLLCVSAGWMPTAHLAAQLGARLTFDQVTQSLRPAADDGVMRPVGAARGVLGTAACLADGKAAAHEVMAELEMHKHLGLPRPDPTPAPAKGFTARRGRAFVDLQNDVTRADLALAQREGYRDVELTKRYTTLGMGTDQGKTSWTNGLIEISALAGSTPAIIGHTTYRPPFSPVTIGALVGTEVGAAMLPTRRTPFHAGFERLDCVFQTSGSWLYPRYFPQQGESMADAVERECRAVRSSLGCVDMSTLGKFDIQGPDARSFLSRLYCNNVATLKPGRLRYGLMLREDGYVLDDGTVAQLGDNHFFVTATTAHSASVWRHIQKCAQIDWPEMNVTLTNVGEHWASLAIAGPKARELLRALDPDFETGPQAFPFAAVREGILGGNLPVRVISVSFSGELSFEINTPAGFAEDLLDRVMERGAEWGITPYGLETLDVLRIEKGHLSVGTEIDGLRVPGDLGIGRMVSTSKDFVGRALLFRPALQAEGREQLIGLVPEDGNTAIPPAAHLSTAELDENGRAPICGQLTAAVRSPTLGHSIALAFLEGGAARMGESLWAHSPVAGRSVRVRVSPTCAYDPKGERLNG